MKSFIGSKAIGVNPNTENMQVSMVFSGIYLQVKMPRKIIMI